MSIKRESLCNLRNFPSKKNHTCVISIFKIWIFLKLRDIHYILRVYSCIWKKNWPIIIGNKFEITKNQSLLHYLPIEGFPYHQASHIHVLTARNIGNVFSSAGICVLVQQTYCICFEILHEIYLQLISPVYKIYIILHICRSWTFYFF